MSYETINVAPVTPRIGAEVDGLTLAKPLSNRQVEELHQALAEHQVLFFRDQPLDVESHKALGRCFGELHIHPNTPGPEGHPEILPIHADANSKRIAGEYWHSDVSCDEEPPLGSILYLHTVPRVGGDTLFASQYAAYDALSPRMKVYLEGLTATHSGEHVYRATNGLVGHDDRGKVFRKGAEPGELCWRGRDASGITALSLRNRRRHRGARRRLPAAAPLDAAGIAACGGRAARALRAPRARPDRGRSSAAALRCRGRCRLDGATRRQPSAAASRWWRPRSRARRAAAPPRPASGSRRRPRTTPCGRLTPRSPWHRPRARCPCCL